MKKDLITKLGSVLLALLLFTALPLSAGAKSVRETSGQTGDCTWTFDEATATLTVSGQGEMINYHHSSPWCGLHVQKAVIEPGVTRVGSRAFFGCGELTDITLPDSLTEIGNYAFGDCTGLTNVTLPNSVKSILYGAFRGCSGLTEFVFPKSVTFLDWYVFKDCTGLKHITIPDNVTGIIGEGAFFRCSGLESVTIGKNITTIKEDAFAGCTNLKSAAVPKNVTAIYNHAFYKCPHLTMIGTLDSKAYEHAKKRDIPFAEKKAGNAGDTGECRWLFDNNSGVLTISGNGKTGHYDYAPCPWQSLPFKKVILAKGVTGIGSEAFKNCAALTDVVISDTVTEIGQDAFSGCAKLENAGILDSVTDIGQNAFDGCTALTITGIWGSTANGYAEQNGISFKPMQHLRGDLDGDARVTGADTGLFNRYVSGWRGYESRIQSQTAADVNSDGKVNGADAGLLSRYVSDWQGYDSYFVPVG